jgi:hypothetical protein
MDVEIKDRVQVKALEVVSWPVKNIVITSP